MHLQTIVDIVVSPEMWDGLEHTKAYFGIVLECTSLASVAMIRSVLPSWGPPISNDLHSPLSLYPLPLLKP